MASTFSPNLRLELIGTGDQQGTWGITTNTNLGTLLEQAIGGYETITVSNVADTTLTTSDGAADQARNMVLNLTGTITAARNVICPAIEKLYVVKNATTGGFAVTFKVTGQTGVSIPNGQTALIYVDGVDARAVTGTLGFLGGASTSSANTFTADQVISVNSVGAALRITQIGSGPPILVEDASNPDSTPFTVTSDGNVGIGTATPAVPLDISSAGIRVNTNRTISGNADNGGIILCGGTSGNGANIELYGSASGTPSQAYFDADTHYFRAADGTSERIRINGQGAIGIGGANFGTSGQVFMSGGSASLPTWTSLGISNVTGLQTALDGKGGLSSNNTWTGIQYYNGGIGPSFTILREGASEGGQFYLQKPDTTTSLNGDVCVDVATSIFRIFESGGTYRGAYLDILNQGDSVASKIFTTADANLNSLNSLGTAAGKFAYTTGVNTWAEANITAAGRAILDDADASAQRTTLGLVIGTNVQAYDATLQSLSGLGTAADRYVYTTGVDTWAEGTITAAGRAILDDANAASQRTTLGLGTIATQNASAVTITGGSISGITDLAVADGGTGASDAATARTNLGLAIGTNVQAYDATLQSLSGLGTAADRYAYTTGVDAWAEGVITAAGRALLDDASASAQRTTLGLGTAATLNAGTAASNVVQLDGSARLPAVDGSQLTNLPAATPSGVLMPYAGTSAPTGWLFAFGQLVSRTTYADLFAALGTTYGAGDGSTTFALPDLRGRVVAGKDDMGGTSANRLTGTSGGLNGDVLGATGGSETHTLLTAEIPSHTHSVGGTFSTTGGTYNVGSGSNDNFASTTSSATGGGGAHNNVQPTIALNYIIKI
jgi:microcystin-dependent protein